MRFYVIRFLFQAAAAVADHMLTASLLTDKAVHADKSSIKHTPSIVYEIKVIVFLLPSGSLLFR